jgi:hypothetical protein
LAAPKDRGAALDAVAPASSEVEMSRSEMQMFARGLFPPPAQVKLESRKFGCVVLMNGFEVVSGSDWNAVYGELRRWNDRLDAEVAAAKA